MALYQNRCEKKSNPKILSAMTLRTISQVQFKRSIPLEANYKLNMPAPGDFP
jgi:hypothetical protein